MYYSKNPRFSFSSSSSSSTISNLRKINELNTINTLNSLQNSFPILYPSYQTEIPQNYYHIPNPQRNSSFNFVANQIISPRNNNNYFPQKKFSYNYNNNINNNFMKGSPVTINQDLKNSKCCAHNGCNAYISDVLYLLKGLKELGIDKKLNTEEDESEETKNILEGKKGNKGKKKKKRETKEEKKKKEKSIKWWKLAKNFFNIYIIFSVWQKNILLITLR